MQLLSQWRRFSSSAVRSSPAANHHMMKHSISPISVTGSGKHGIITKQDVLSFLQFGAGAKAEVQAQQITPLQDPNYVDEPTSNMRNIIAKRLLSSKQNSPHLYLSIKSDITACLELRKRFKAIGISISMNDLVIQAVAKSLAKGRDISVAVATPTGLITPIVTEAASRGLAGINKTVKELAGRARENKLKLEEFQGGDFTVSNLGMFGIDAFTAVVNDPQPGILAVGTSKKKVRAKAEFKGEEKLTKDMLEVYDEMEVTLTVDRKRIDESKAAEFLQTFSRNISTPELMQL